MVFSFTEDHCITTAKGTPFVSGSSVIAVKYNKGVMIIADTVGTYFGTARFKNIKRIKKLGHNAMISGTGDLADFQFISGKLNGKINRDVKLDDGFSLSPKEIFNSASSLLYKRRSKIDPLVTNLIIAGFSDNKSFLGSVDLYGTAFVEDFIATGFGLHLATPLLRKEWREDMTEDDARALLQKCVRVLIRRDSHAANCFIVAKQTDGAYEVSQPFSIDVENDFSHSLWAFEA